MIVKTGAIGPKAPLTVDVITIHHLFSSYSPRKPLYCLTQDWNSVYRFGVYAWIRTSAKVTPMFRLFWMPSHSATAKDISQGYSNELLDTEVQVRTKSE